MDLPDNLSSRLEDYMKNNKEVPENILQDLKNGLNKPHQELSDLKAKLSELMEQWSALEERKYQLEDLLAEYDCVLSPIRRVPTDILHNIFYHCLPTRRDPIMSTKEAPLLLTRICRVWRQTALMSPSLWAQIYITFSDEESLPDSEISYGLSRQYLSDALRLRCIAVEQWLSRSGVRPLSISICYTSRVWGPAGENFPGNTENTLTLFRILSQFSSRWQNLRLEMPIEVYRIFESMVPVSQLLALKSLKASFAHHMQSPNSTQERQATFFDAPNLATISLSRPELWGSFRMLTSTSPPMLTTLSNLVVQCRIKPLQAASLLKICPNLEYLMLTLVTDDIDPQVSTPVSSRDMITLPRLRAIAITDYVSPISKGHFYDCVAAPKLEWIDYKEQRRSHETVYETFPIVSLLKQSSQLKKFTIEANDWTSQDLRLILQSIPSITHLVFAPKTKLNNQPFVRSLDPVDHTKWDVGEIFLGDNSVQDSSIEECCPPSTLLPNLEVLEISQAAAAQLEDKTLLNIILSRLELNTSPKKALLKKLTVLFARPEKMDITKEVMTHLEHHGHQIELDLLYICMPRSYGSHFVSPEYGIDHSRSWNNSYKDEDLAEELASSIG